MRVKHSDLVAHRGYRTGADVVAHLDFHIDFESVVHFLQHGRLHVCLENQRSGLRNGDFVIAVVVRKCLCVRGHERVFIAVHLLLHILRLRDGIESIDTHRHLFQVNRLPRGLVDYMPGDTLHLLRPERQRKKLKCQ